MNFLPLASSSKGNAYLVTSPGSAPLLIECGVSINRLREALYKHNMIPTSLAGCLISHSHSDHCRAAKDLMKAGVDVWTSKQTAEILGIEEHHRFAVLETGRYSFIGDWLVVPFDLNHDAPCQGFLVVEKGKEPATLGDQLLFVPDTPFVKNRFEHITILVIECNHSADILSKNIQNGTVPAVVGHRTRRNHLELETVKNFILANGMQETLREVHLIHLSEANSDEEGFRREIQELTGRPVYVAAS